MALVRGVARLGQEEYNRLQQEIRASPVVYGDETGWREAGRNGYLWSFSNPEVRYFLRRGSRGSKVVAEVLGDEFDGVLVSDFWSATSPALTTCIKGCIRDVGPTCCGTSTN